MRRFLISIAFLIAISQVQACYYLQAIRGHSQIMSARQPIADVIADDETPDDVARRLIMVQAARDFAVDELLLADNESYRSYADLERDYVVWNVFAAPEFSLEPKTWCFPVAGCVAYRGYFAEEKARAKARSLADDGFDVVVGGVSAYSTLGKFADPVLNTMMRWSDEQLVTTIFHELAHQKLYIKGDSAFNESFATAVADIGIRRWLDERRDAEGMARVENTRKTLQLMMSLIDEAKGQLGDLYRSGLDDAEKRARKQAILDELSVAVVAALEESGSDAGNWLAEPLNNARLASFGLYEGYQGAFRRIIDDCAGALACFYEEAERIAALDAAGRKSRLDQLQGQSSPATASAGGSIRARLVESRRTWPVSRQ